MKDHLSALVEKLEAEKERSLALIEKITDALKGAFKDDRSEALKRLKAWEIAFHESGHAVTTFRLGLAFDTVAIWWEGRFYGGHVTFAEQKPLPRFKDAVIDLAGIIAQTRFCKPELSAVALEQSSDMQNYRAHRLSGREDALVRKRANQMVLGHWREICVVAKHLVTAGSATFDEVRDLIRADYRLNGYRMED